MLVIHYTLFHYNDPSYSSDLGGSTFSWGVEAKNAFQSLKTYLTIASLLIHVNPSKPFVLETDASNFALGVVVSQLGKYNLFHPVGFHSCKFPLVKINYKVHDKKIWPSWMPLRNGIIYLKELNMKSLCTLITRIYNIS
jgi:hypothetical protein